MLYRMSSWLPCFPIAEQTKLRSPKVFKIFIKKLGCILDNLEGFLGRFSFQGLNADLEGFYANLEGFLGRFLFQGFYANLNGLYENLEGFLGRFSC